MLKTRRGIYRGWEIWRGGGLVSQRERVVMMMMMMMMMMMDEEGGKTDWVENGGEERGGLFYRGCFIGVVL